MAAEERIAIESELDIVTARQRGRQLAAEVGFGSTDQTLIATAISEVARNIVAYAGRGEVLLSRVDGPGPKGIRVVASDRGPGIADLKRAMRDGYSTGGSLGLGLPGTKRLMDDFELASEPGHGTTVRMAKWLR